MQKVAIQGYEGSFHQIAARQFFGEDVEVAPCATFLEVVESTKKGETSASIMAIENSIAGSILPNYGLLQKSKLKIIGEVYLPVEQHLMVSPGVRFDDIREVHSHPMAIQQCLPYLLQHKWKLVETVDTALSAKHIHQHKSKHTAAIASSLAAELYDLEILDRNIHVEKKNYTRFLVLKKGSKLSAEGNKASLSFQTDHSIGSLAKVLTTVAKGKVNLSKLQSFPVPGSDWLYYFHADMEFNSVEQLNTILSNIEPLTTNLQVYGIYNNGKLN